MWIRTKVQGKARRSISVDLINSSDTKSENNLSDDESNPDKDGLKERRNKALRLNTVPSKSITKKWRTGPALTTYLAVRPTVNGA